jgi:hypothetical protein
VDIDGTKHTVAAQDGVPVIDGTTILAQGSLKTFDGNVVSVIDGCLVITTEPIILAGDPTRTFGDRPQWTLAVAGQTFTASPGTSEGVLIVGGTTILAGHAAATLHGATTSAAPDGLVVNGSIVSFADASGTGHFAVLTLDSDVLTAFTILSDVFAIGSLTLTAGGSAITVSGHVVSPATSEIVVESTLTSASASRTEDTESVEGMGTATASGAQPDNSAEAASGATKLDGLQWMAAMACGLVLL